MSEDNIRKFRDDIDETPSERVKKKTKRRRQLMLYRILAIVIVIGLAVFFYYRYVTTKVFETATTISSVSSDLIRKGKLLNFAGDVLCFSKDGAECIDKEGNLKWNTSFNMQAPMCALCEKTAAFADYGQSTIYIATSEGKLSEIDTNKPILKLTTSDAGYVAAVLDDTDITWIYLYDVNGNEIAYFRTTMKNSGYPIDISLSPSAELIGVSYYMPDSTGARSSVAFYNFGEVGANVVDNYVSGYNYSGVLIPIVKFLNNSAAFSLSSSRISFYNGEHKPVSVSETMLLDEVVSVFSGNGYVMIVTPSQTISGGYLLTVYNKSGDILCKKDIDFDYTDIEFGKDWFVVYSDNRILVSDVDGKQRFDGAFDDTIYLLLPTVINSKYTIVTEDYLGILELK